VNRENHEAKTRNSALQSIMSGHLPWLPPYWIAIAERPRDSAPRSTLVWRKLPGAPFGPLEARRLADKGAIIMANRHFPDRVELLVRPARNIITVSEVPTMP
jgi:hypothetical protein